jgi:carbonic anhydrase
MAEKKPIPSGGRAQIRDLLRRDLPASLVVFLAAVPLSVGIALASGAPPVAGLIAAAVGGVVVGFLGGAPLQVSGPAAGLTVLVFGFVQQFGWAVTCAITVAAGLLQILLGALRIGSWTLAFVRPVICGMLAAVGLLTILTQLPVLLGGHPSSPALSSLPSLKEQIATASASAAGLGAFTIAVILAWPRLALPRLRAVPAPLVATAAATAIAFAARVDIPRVQVGGDILSQVTVPELPTGHFAAFAAAVLALAAVGSGQSLLCAIAVDRLHRGPRANRNRELVALGLGNIASGMLGGLAMTGLIVRSSANVAAGARTHAAAVLHGFWFLIFVTGVASALEQIPLTVLAGLLIYTGYRLVQAQPLRDLAKQRETQIFAVTLVAVVALNLVAGLALGFAAAALRLLWNLAHVELRIASRDGVCRVQILGTLTFAAVPVLTKRLGDVPPGAEVDVHLAVRCLDQAGIAALGAWKESYEQAGGLVRIGGIEEIWETWIDERPDVAEEAVPDLPRTR